MVVVGLVANHWYAKGLKLLTKILFELHYHIDHDHCPCYFFSVSLCFQTQAAPWQYDTLLLFLVYVKLTYVLCALKVPLQNTNSRKEHTGESNAINLSHILSKLMWFLKSPLNFDSIVFYHKFNCDSKSHINFRSIKFYWLFPVKENIPPPSVFLGLQ